MRLRRSNRTIQRLQNDIEARKNKISLIDKIAFSSEQECKLTEQRVQELTAQNDRLEKFVANILRRYNEVYLKLKQFVTAVLSDNKILLSTPFVALPILYKPIHNWLD